MAEKKKGATKPKWPKIAYVDANELETLSLAIRIVVEEKKASTSLIQRRLKTGYSQAALILDRLEELAVITPMKGTEPRKLTGYVPTLKAKPITVPPGKVEVVKEKPKVGRPSKFTQELADEICRRLAQGESVLQICRTSEHMPEARTVYSWLLDEDKEDFQKKYTRAREIQAEVFHDELTEIADDGSNDWMEIETKSGGSMTVVDHEHVNRSRLRVDTRKWIISRMNPRKYGEKLDVTSGGKAIKEPKQAIIKYIVPTAPKGK